MPVPAPERFSAVGPVLVALLVLGGCGNRGELYLESPFDADDELRALDVGDLVEDVAPTVAPEFDPEAGDESDGDREEGGSGEGREPGRRKSGS